MHWPVLIIHVHEFVSSDVYFESQWPGTLGEFRSVVKDTKSNTKHFTKSISIHSDYQSEHFW